jgi:hypothetical protein
MIFFPAAALIALVIGFTLIVREMAKHDREHRK